MYETYYQLNLHTLYVQHSGTSKSIGIICIDARWLRVKFDTHAPSSPIRIYSFKK